jgi:hypothetical protein
MVAGDRPPADSEFVHQLGGEAEVSFDPGAIGGHIAGMDHEIGMLVGDPCRERPPIGDEMWLVPAQMRVGNLNNSHEPPFGRTRLSRITVSRHPPRSGFWVG